MEKEEDFSFNSWLFSKQEILEKTVGLAILFLEIVNHIQEIYGLGREELTTILNLFFLLFIFFILKRDLPRRYSLKEGEPALERILRLSHGVHKKEKLDELVKNSNTFISQLRNIRYFILCEAALYFFLLVEGAVKTIAERPAIRNAISHLFRLSPSDIDTMGFYSNHGFHLLFDLCSYLGAFFLLRCFFVMYLPTVDEKGNDVLNKQTNIFWGVLIGLMVFDVFVMRHKEGHFTTEFVCGITNSVVFILFIARFENKILDIPPAILCILYIYAILQTCLPFVTGGTELIPGGHKVAETGEYLDEFKSVVLTICLVGKVALSAVLLYVLNTGRIFYYFITLRRLHEEEERNWKALKPLMEVHSAHREPISILYECDVDGSYTASIPDLGSNKAGRGDTEKEARADLVNKLQ